MRWVVKRANNTYTFSMGVLKAFSCNGSNVDEVLKDAFIRASYGAMSKNVNQYNRSRNAISKLELKILLYHITMYYTEWRNKLLRLDNGGEFEKYTVTSYNLVSSRSKWSLCYIDFTPDLKIHSDGYALINGRVPALVYENNLDVVIPIMVYDDENTPEELYNAVNYSIAYVIAEWLCNNANHSKPIMDTLALLFHLTKSRRVRKEWCDELAYIANDYKVNYGV